MRDRGTSVLVTTHQLDEAEQHCDVAAIMDHGELLCMDAPRALLEAHGMEIQAELPAGAVSDDDLCDLAGATQVQTTNGRTYAFGRGEAFRAAVTTLAIDSGVVAADIGTGRARLEDLFLLLTGRSYREG
jgi:ABC-2 type transport system ATP-binding protein